MNNQKKRNGTLEMEEIDREDDEDMIIELSKETKNIVLTWTANGITRVMATVRKSGPWYILECARSAQDRSC